jgi:transposase
LQHHLFEVEMISTERPLQNTLFAPKDLGARIPDDHILRKIAETLDLTFVTEAVEDKYGAVGHEAIPPTRIMKLLILLVLYNVTSERALFRDLAMRIDWLWFLGYDLSSVLPGHSVLSKARKRWGPEVFHRLFAQTIELCLEAGLIDGHDLLADSSLIDANASVDSMFRAAQAVAAAATTKLADVEEQDGGENVEQDASSQTEDRPSSSEAKYRSRTDPDATGAKRRGETHVRPRYQTHRAVDSAQGVITATVVGPGHENEAHRLPDLVAQHTEHTGQRVSSMTADSKYGTADNLEYCESNDIDAFISPFRSNYTRPKVGKFRECCFRYDQAGDFYLCPTGQRLTRRGYRPDKDADRYVAPPEACAVCPVRAFCTTSKVGRSIHRPTRMAILERASARVRTAEGKAHRKRRRWMMEGSFAHSVRLGYKRARARGLRNMQIQDYLVAAIQNLLILIRAKVKITLDTTSRKFARLAHRLISFVDRQVRGPIPAY